MKRRRLIRSLFLLPLVYLAAYASLRVSGWLTHFENRGDPERAHEIRVPTNQFTDLEMIMAKETGDPLVMVYETRWQFIDLLFWPVRSAETLLWKLVT